HVRCYDTRPRRGLRRSGRRGMKEGGSRRVLALGVVTFENSATELAHLARSIAGAAERLEGTVVSVHTVENGHAPAPWPEGELAISRLAGGGNVGFARAVNRLLEAAFSDRSVDRFVCLNPDGVLHRRALRELVTASELHRDASLVEAR